MGDLQLDINKKDAKEFLEFFTFKRQKFISDNEEVFNKLQEYNELIKKFESVIDRPQQKDYPLGTSWNQRIKYFLSQSQDGLTARGITKKIIYTESIKSADEEKRVYSSVAATLSAGSGTLYERVSNEKNEYVYTLKNLAP